MTRLALLPHVFLSGHRPPAPPTAYVTARALRAAIAANAALGAFAGDDDATRTPAGAAGFSAPASSSAAPSAAGGHAAPAGPPASAPDHAAPGRDAA
jgi:hypothetical protein